MPHTPTELQRILEAEHTGMLTAAELLCFWRDCSSIWLLENPRFLEDQQKLIKNALFLFRDACLAKSDVKKLIQAQMYVPLCMPVTTEQRQSGADLLQAVAQSENPATRFMAARIAMEITTSTAIGKITGIPIQTGPLYDRRAAMEIWLPDAFFIRLADDRVSSVRAAVASHPCLVTQISAQMSTQISTQIPAQIPAVPELSEANKKEENIK